MKTWLRPFLAPLFVGCSLLVALAPSPARANHSANGSGGCNSHTVTCYPNCRYEWTGNRGSITDPPQDNGPCSMPPEYSTPVTGFVGVTDTVTVGGTVTVTEPVTVDGSVSVSGTVTADRGAGWPESGTTPASSVFLENTDSDAIPVRLASTDENYMLIILAFLAFGVTVGSVVFRWIHR